MNLVALIGRLTDDPDLSFTATDTAICRFRLAVPNPRPDTKPDFVTIVTFGSFAEVQAQHLAKGWRVAIAGRLSHSEWTGPEGQPRSRLEVIANNVDWLNPPRPSTQPDDQPEPAGAEEPF